MLNFINFYFGGFFLTLQLFFFIELLVCKFVKPNSAKCTFAKVCLNFSGRRVFAKIPGINYYLVRVLCDFIFTTMISHMIALFKDPYFYYNKNLILHNFMQRVFVAPRFFCDGVSEEKTKNLHVLCGLLKKIFYINSNLILKCNVIPEEKNFLLNTNNDDFEKLLKIYFQQMSLHYNFLLVQFIIMLRIMILCLNIFLLMIYVRFLLLF